MLELRHLKTLHALREADSLVEAAAATPGRKSNWIWPRASPSRRCRPWPAATSTWW